MFNPYNLRILLRASPPEAPPIITDIDIEEFIASAVAKENQQFQDNADDSEGVDLKLDPPIPLTTAPLSPEKPSPRPSVPRSAEKLRKQNISQKSRKRKRILMAEAGHKPDDYAPNPRVIDSCLEQGKTVKITSDAANLPRASEGSWIGKRQPGIGDNPWPLAQLQEIGYRTIEWNGNETVCILDSESRIVAVLVGHPVDPEWSQVCTDAAELMLDVGKLGCESEAFSGKYLNHRRGDFVALPVGVSFGGGQTEPGNMFHSDLHGRQLLINSLLASKSIQRIAGFQSSAFAAYAPKLYQYFATTLSKLFHFHSNLLHNFKNSIFPATSFNLGPSTVSLHHVDYGNLSHGLCALTALGSYNPRLGGHLVLFPFRLAIEFPPGSTVLIPSGCVDHGNTPIQEGETRLSIAQYAAGGLFRWVAYGFCTAKSLLKTKAGKEKKEKFDMEEDKRWKMGLLMFSKHSELQLDIKNVYNN